MVNRKISRIIGPAAGIMGFMIAISAVSVPACAAETAISQSMDSGYEINQNGVRFKVTDIAGTKNKVKITALIKKKDGIKDFYTRNMKINIYMDNLKVRSGGQSVRKVDENTIKIVTHIEGQEETPNKGNIRADLILGEYDFNGSIIVPVDFTESFKLCMEKDLDLKQEKSTARFESDVIGTRIITKESGDKSSISKMGYLNDDRTKYIVKVGDKIYNLDRGDVDYEDNIIYHTYESEKLTYNDIKDAEKISIIPVESSFTEEQLRDYYSEDRIDNRVIENNVKYSKEILFNDGKNGKIKAERSGNKIKFYCTSDSDEKSLLMATRIHGCFSKNDKYHQSADDLVVYKDADNEHQYIAEFDDADKDATFEAYVDKIISHNDKFMLGNEISIK